MKNILLASILAMTLAACSPPPDFYLDSGAIIYVDHEAPHVDWEKLQKLEDQYFFWLATKYGSNAAGRCRMELMGFEIKILRQIPECGGTKSVDGCYYIGKDIYEARIELENNYGSAFIPLQHELHHHCLRIITGSCDPYHDLHRDDWRELLRMQFANGEQDMRSIF